MASITSHVCDHCGAAIPRLPSDHFKAFDSSDGDIAIDIRLHRQGSEATYNPDLCADCLVSALNRAQAQIKAERDNV